MISVKLVSFYTVDRNVLIPSRALWSTTEDFPDYQALLN